MSFGRATVTREQISAALFTLLQGAAGFNTIGRKHWMPTELSDNQFPALFLVKVKEKGQPEPMRSSGTYLIYYDAFIYVKDDGADQEPGQETNVPETQLNTILDAIQLVMNPPGPDGVQNLGFQGVVHRAWIEGQIDTDQGVLGKIGMAIVPINVLAVV